MWLGVHPQRLWDHGPGGWAGWGFSEEPREKVGWNRTGTTPSLEEGGLCLGRVHSGETLCCVTYFGHDVGQAIKVCLTV